MGSQIKRFKKASDFTKNLERSERMKGVHCPIPAPEDGSRIMNIQSIRRDGET